jgi:ParB-like chromosome segregation protein Spo0J
MFWDWSLCQPLAVAKRDDGGLMVVDGQHRLEAARLRGDIEDLPCVVTAYRNAGDEAAAFVALNQQRRPLARSTCSRPRSRPRTRRRHDRAAADRGRAAARAAYQFHGVEAGHGVQHRRHPAASAEGRARDGLALQALARGLPARCCAMPARSSRHRRRRRAGAAGRGQDRRSSGWRPCSPKSQVEWRTEITLEAAATGVERKLAAKNLIARSTARPRSTAAPVALPPTGRSDGAGAEPIHRRPSCAGATSAIAA